MCAFRPPPCRVLGHVFEGSLLDLVCICRNRSRNVRRPAQTEAVTSGPRVQAEAASRRCASNPKPPATMPKLVAPDGIMYVVNDTGPDQADLAERRADLPPKKNLNQLLGWCGPADVTSP